MTAKKKVKTDDILNLDCTKKENLDYMCRFLNHIKPFKRMQERNNFEYKDLRFLEQIEKTIQGISIKYGYRTQGVATIYLENDETGVLEFAFYQEGLMDKERNWIGTVMGKTLLEVEAKALIKIYADIKRKEKKIEE